MQAHAGRDKGGSRERRRRQGHVAAAEGSSRQKGLKIAKVARAGQGEEEEIGGGWQETEGI